MNIVRFVPYNECAKCGEELVIVETDTDVVRIDATGRPIARENVLTKMSMRCFNCNENIEVSFKGMRYIKKSNTTPIIRDNKKNPFGAYSEEVS